MDRYTAPQNSMHLLFNFKVWADENELSERIRQELEEQSFTTKNALLGMSSTDIEAFDLNKGEKAALRYALQMLRQQWCVTPTDDTHDRILAEKNLDNAKVAASFLHSLVVAPERKHWQAMASAVCPEASAAIYTPDPFVFGSFVDDTPCSSTIHDTGLRRTVSGLSQSHNLGEFAGHPNLQPDAMISEAAACIKELLNRIGTGQIDLAGVQQSLSSMYNAFSQFPARQNSHGMVDEECMSPGQFSSSSEYSCHSDSSTKHAHAGPRKRSATKSVRHERTEEQRKRHNEACKKSREKKRLQAEAQQRELNERRERETNERKEREEMMARHMQNMKLQHPVLPQPLPSSPYNSHYLPTQPPYGNADNNNTAVSEWMMTSSYTYGYQESVTSPTSYTDYEPGYESRFNQHPNVTHYARGALPVSGLAGAITTTGDYSALRGFDFMAADESGAESDIDSADEYDVPAYYGAERHSLLCLSESHSATQVGFRQRSSKAKLASSCRNAGVNQLKESICNASRSTLGQFASSIIGRSMCRSGDDLFTS